MADSIFSEAPDFFSPPDAVRRAHSSLSLQRRICMKVFIVEDFPQTRQELVELLAAVDGFEVVGQAGTVQEALFSMEAAAPEAVVLDISLPDGSGVEVLKYVRRRGWALRVVVLTGNLYEALRVKCEQLGATAVLHKINGLAQAREALLAGERGQG
jgi:two-component system, NarL family, response regulator DevR